MHLTRRASRGLITTFTAAATTALLTTTTATPGLAAHRPAPPATPGWTTVASGLDNPRLLSWSGNALYVAESGRGGDGPCITSPEDPEASACLGRSGAITEVRLHPWRRATQRRVVTGLPSVAGATGNDASGPADVVVRGRQWWATIGLGGTTAVRASLGRDGTRLGTVQTGLLGGHGRHSLRHRKGHAYRTWTVADLAAHEARNDPDGEGEDSNPTGLAAAFGGLAVTDSGGNSLLRTDRHGRVSTLATLPTRLVPPPPFLPPGDIPMQSVPTSVAQGPDGAWYVGELTGFPFPVGASTVWRIPARGGAPTAYATGLTNVTDLAWHRGRLYAVQLVDSGMLTADPEASIPLGSLRRINRDGTATVVAEGLPAPYGVALKGSSAYVTTCTFCAGGGAVVRVPLR